MTDLSVRIRGLAARVGEPVPAPDLTREPLVADATRSVAPAPRMTAPTDRNALIARLLGLPLDQFAEAGLCLEVRVPWASEPLWFVPTEADAEDRAGEGIHRGRIWTAAQLGDLFAIPEITKAQARTIAETKLVFEGDVVAVKVAPDDEPACDAGAPARRAVSTVRTDGVPHRTPDRTRSR